MSETPFLAAVIGSFFRPTVVTWNRLEPRPRTASFERSLRAEVRDPLWMLCRQWQVGEFAGHDGGTSVKTQLEIETVRLNRYAARGRPAVPYDDVIALETIVEREPVPLDLTTRALAGRHFVKLLARETGTDLRPLYLAEYAFAEPTDDLDLAQLRSDQAAWQATRVLVGRVIDGGQLLNAIASGQHAAFVAASPMSATDQAAATAAAAALVEWFSRVFDAPAAPEEDAWAPSYLEYQMACAADANGREGETGAQTVLEAEEYHHGHLDWYSFDIRDTEPGDGLVDLEPGSVPHRPPQRSEPLALVPAPIEFDGMPNLRWWQLEDQQTDFGALSAGTTDLALLLLAEFGIIYGNDWSLVPYDLEVGSLARITGMVVTDSFGERTLIRAAGRAAGDDWQRWGMYHLSAADGPSDTRLFLAPTLPKSEQGPPVEQVVLARDDVANMVWGIETVIPGVLGDGVNGFETATALTGYLARRQPPDTGPEPVETDAEIRYVLGTTVPENWIPFIAVHELGSNRQIRLQRAAMPRLVTGDLADVVEPRGVLLRQGLDQGDSYFVHEEEVPRSGAVVSRSFQRARWRQGRVSTWMGRRKRTGLGPGASGLRFDRIEPR
jgi:hypothetical protein